MTRNELIKAIKKCRAVYGAVQTTSDDVEYIQLVKKDLLYRITKSSVYDKEFKATLSGSSNNILFIN